MAGKNLQGITDGLMMDMGGIKPHGEEAELQDGPHAEGADQRADAHRAAQQEAHQRGTAEHQDSHRTDGDALQPPLEPHQQGVSGAAAQGSAHIIILGIGHDGQPNQHHQHAAQQAFGDGNHINGVEKVHRFSHHEGIYNHCKANRLPEPQVNEQNGEGNGDGGGAVQDAEGFGNAQTQHIPRPCADAGMNGEIDAQSVDEQADRSQNHTYDNVSCGVVAVSDDVAHSRFASDGIRWN